MTTPLRLNTVTLCVLLGATAAVPACTKPGQTLAQAVPNLEARTGAPLADHLPWDVPSTAWDGAAPLDMRAALATGLQNNRALRRALAEVDLRRARYQDSQLPPNPMLDIGVGIPIDMGVTPVLAMLSAQIDWLWKREALIGETDAALRSALFEAAAQTVATAIDVRAAYIDAASAQELLAFAQRNEQTSARIMNAITLSFEQGEGSAQAVNEARIAWSDALSRAMDAQQALLVAKTRLLESIGRGDLDMEWRTVAATAHEAAHECALQVPPHPQDQSELMALVRERRLDLRAADARVEGASQRLRLAQASQWPSVNVGGGWERDMEGDSAAMIAAQVSVPIFNQGQFREAAARADLEMARIDADALWQQALLETWRARGALATMEHHAVQLRDVTMEAVRANLRVTSASVEAGEAATLRLWQGELQESRVRAQLAASQRDAAIAALAFERALAGARLPSGSSMGRTAAADLAAGMGAAGGMGGTSAAGNTVGGGGAGGLGAQEGMR